NRQAAAYLLLNTRGHMERSRIAKICSRRGEHIGLSELIALSCDADPHIRHAQDGELIERSAIEIEPPASKLLVHSQSAERRNLEREVASSRPKIVQCTSVECERRLSIEQSGSCPHDGCPGTNHVPRHTCARR